MKTPLTKLLSVGTLACAILTYVLLASNSTGVVGYSTSGCSCHGSNTSNTVLTISGLPASGWQAGTAYTITITVSNTTKSAAGFDLSVNIGTLGSAPGGTSLNGSTEIRHTAPKSLSSGSASWSFTWTAPSSTATALVINFSGNAVNGNSQDTGDEPNNTSQTFNAAAPPTATTNAATAVGTTAATLNGSVTAKNSNTTVTFEYGTTTAYGSSVAATPGTVTGNTATAVSATISGLTAATTYHYRVKAVNATGTTNGSDMTFTTTAAGSAPVITVQAPTSLTNTGVHLNALVNANGASTTVSCVWGKTTTYGNSATVTPSPVTGTTGTAVSATLTGLTKNTLYHYKFSATNSSGTNAGKDTTFTTTSLSIGNSNRDLVRVYPNPVTEVLIIEMDNSAELPKAVVTDAAGRMMPLQIWRDGDHFNLNTSGWSAGIYFLRIEKGGTTYSAKLFKQ